MANERTEYEALIKHINHDVDIRVPGFDAPVFVWCLSCDEGVLAYSDPDEMYAWNPEDEEELDV